MARIYNALFTGQGAQYVGMLDEFIESQTEILNKANEILGYDLVEISRDENKIYQTKFTQPFNFIYEYLKYKTFSNEYSWTPQYMIGHSMGEFVALTCANVLKFEDGLRLISKRAELMSQVESGYRMVSVIGIDIQDIEKLCNSYEDKYGKKVLISNCNGSLQTIVSIEDAEIERFKTFSIEKYSIVMIKELKVLYPFHTRYMKPFADEFKETVEKTEFLKPQVGLILNANGRCFESEDLLVLKKYMVEQMYMPVRFTECMKQGFFTGVNTWIEFGPKPVLAKMLKREYNTLDVFHVNELLGESSEWEESTSARVSKDEIEDVLGKYLYVLSSSETKSENADYSSISGKYRLLKKLHSSFENKVSSEDYEYQIAYAKTLFEDAMSMKGYTKDEFCEFV